MMMLLAALLTLSAHAGEHSAGEAARPVPAPPPMRAAVITALSISPAPSEPMGVIPLAPATPAAEIVPFRLHIKTPGVYLLKTQAKGSDDSVGERLAASLHETELRAALGERVWDGETLFVTGVPMGEEQVVLGRVHAAMALSRGTPERVAVRVLSRPRPWDRGRFVAARDRLIYFLPSKVRDYQTPLRDEVISGAGSTLLLEAPNAVYLLSVMPMPDGAIVLGAHGVLLGLFTIFQRSMGNWILRANGLELYMKSALAALPFIVNYSVLGHFSAIAAFARVEGAAGLGREFAPRLLEFAVTQGLTTALQVAFYCWVVNRGFRGWAAGQKTPEDSAAARSWVNWLLVPWLWLDAIFLTQAATLSMVIWRWHALVLTGGHLLLAALTVAGSVVVFSPNLIDKTLPFYKRLRAQFSRSAP
jgi:hypothetical protein